MFAKSLAALLPLAQVAHTWHTPFVANRLANALSPYLQQHADNPVEWWEWGDAAFAEARARDVPIFLSVGYAACHWCHVMAHESFEDPAAADILNAEFVAIKVDREERPDVDAVYMRATTALTGRGGWPMSVWLDHEGRPFYAGTYFPPQARPGIPAFTQVLAAISEAWQTRRHDLSAAAARIQSALDSESRGLAVGSLAPAVDDATPLAGIESSQSEPAGELLADAVSRLQTNFDRHNGGFGPAPKFPPSMVLLFLLRHHERTGDPAALRMVSQTCAAMARGGMYDQLAGGFARYSVDDTWTVPHFEKMLYDNALLLRVYAQLWRITGEPLARRVALETGEFLLRDLHTPTGGFAASLDADSRPAPDSPLGPADDVIEGAAYVWTMAELRAVLGDTDGAWVADLCGVTSAGTFERGTSTLRLLGNVDDAPEYAGTKSASAERWQRCRSALLAARMLRPQPSRDDKVITEWNAMVITALVEAGRILHQPDWLRAARDTSDYLLAVHRDPAGRLVRVSRDGVCGASKAVLADVAQFSEALLTLVQLDGELRYLDAAAALLTDDLADFLEPGDSGRKPGDPGRNAGDPGYTLWDAPADGVLPRSFDPSDNAYPSGGAALASAMLLWEDLIGTTGQVSSSSLLAGAHTIMGNHPRFAGMWLATLTNQVRGPIQIVIVGPESATRAELVHTAVTAAPNGSICLSVPEPTPALALTTERTELAGQPTAYVCHHFTCSLPITDPHELRAHISRLATPSSASQP